MVEALIPIVETVFAGNGPLSGLVILLIALALKMGSVYEFVERVRRRRIDMIERALGGDYNLSPETRLVFEDVRAALWFQSIMGVYAEEPQRQAIRRLYERCESNISWRQIARADDFLVTKGKEVCP